ncbi:MAG: hypothetical protein ACKOA0_13880, partial [Burkholderiaceae bacterium]
NTPNPADTAYVAMISAEQALAQFNVQHPLDALQAARATAEQALAFARQRNAREVVSLQWLKVIAVDLGNDGVHIIDLPGTVGEDLDSLQRQRIPRFDVDGDGFREATQWIEPADAILAIDRSGNDLIDDGGELFNSVSSPFDQHGLGSLAYLDANNDGLLTPLDPAFRQLRLWLDLDGDGSTGALEVFDLWMRSASASPGSITDPRLAAMVVTAIDLSNGTLRFTDGRSSRMIELNLLAHTQGLQIEFDPYTANLNVLHEDGLRENFITLVDDMSALLELTSPSVTPARRSELYALASRYGLNPFSSDFPSIVNSLRASGQAMGEQDTVIYFGDDTVWVDPAIRERLEQMRISFRKLNDTAHDNQPDAQLLTVGSNPKATSLGNLRAFDDRWVPSRKLSAADISSDAAAVVSPPAAPIVLRPIAPQIYSLIAATKGAQIGGLVAQIPVLSSDPSKPVVAGTPT